MAREKKPEGLTGIEPTQMQVPAMDRPSVAFAWFLDRMVIEDDERRPGVDRGMYLTCGYCGGQVCRVEDGDTLRVLLNTALAHDCHATS